MHLDDSKQHIELANFYNILLMTYSEYIDHTFATSIMNVRQRSCRWSKKCSSYACCSIDNRSHRVCNHVTKCIL